MSAKNVITKRTIKFISRRNYSVIATDKPVIWSADNVVSSPCKSVKIPNTTIVNYIWERIEKWPSKTAVICAITNRFYTYQQIYKYSRNFGARLRSRLQIRDGDVICAMMPNCPEYCVVTLGSLEAGAILTTMNPIYTAHEVYKQLLLSNPKIIIGCTETINVIKDALVLAKLNIPIMTVKRNNDNLPLGTIDFEEFANDDSIDLSVLNEVSRKPEDVALLPYSSGTTGLPKGVELINRNLIANIVQSDGISNFKTATESFQDSVLSVLPFYHIYGLSIIMLHRFSLGAKLVTLPKFQPNTFLSALKEHKISYLPVVPPMVLFLGSYPDSKKEHLDSVQTMTCGAAPLPKNDLERLFEKTHPALNFSHLYGLTETAPLVTIEPPGSHNHRVAGIPIPNTELKVIGEDKVALGPDQVGELLIRGPQVMKGYRNNQEATKNSIDEDGWFHSGDLAALSKDGDLTIHDRLKELIKVKGYQVPPAELENILKEHPDVFDAAVIGIPDTRMGEAPKAFVVIKDGQGKNSNDIMNFVNERVADYKRLKDIVFVDNLPRNPSGKLLKRVLKDLYC